MKRIKVLTIGQRFMGGIAHSRAILEANQQLRPRGLELVLDCVAARNADKLNTTGEKYGYSRTSTEREREVGKADLVVITTPNREHTPMAIAALKAGKAVVCEKPLARNLQEAREIEAATKKAGTPTMVTFCCQGAPGALEARRLIQNGAILGKSGYFEGTCEFLQDWGRSNRFDGADQGLPLTRFRTPGEIGEWKPIESGQEELGERLAPHQPIPDPITGSPYVRTPSRTRLD
jgi:predicted dehydrogenase